MVDKELGGPSKRSKCTCPSFTMFIVYSSVVVVLLGILVPFEFSFGIIKLVRDIEKKISFHDKSWMDIALQRLGYDKSASVTDKVFTKEELQKYSGDSRVLYLAILGKVFDVTKGKQHYGKEGSYRFFTGKDASRSFVTGEFHEQGLIDNIANLPPKDYIGLIEWMKFYEKDYKYVGKVEGYFYDKQGNPMEGLQIFENGYQHGLLTKAKEDDDRKLFPECNSKWTKDEGTTVYCTKNSGGIHREWVGIPRQYFKVGETKYRCACIETKYVKDPRFKEYKNCSPESTSCKLE